MTISLINKKDRSNLLLILLIFNLCLLAFLLMSSFEGEEKRHSNNLNIKKYLYHYPDHDIQELSFKKQEKITNELNFARSFIKLTHVRNTIELELLVDTLAPFLIEEIIFEDEAQVKAVYINDNKIDFETTEKGVLLNSHNNFKHKTYRQDKLSPINIKLELENKSKFSSISIKNLYNHKNISTKVVEVLQNSKEVEVIKSRTFTKGVYRFKQNLLIPKDAKVKFIGDVTFLMDEGTFIESYASFTINGQLNIKPLKQSWGSLSFHFINGGMKNINIQGSKRGIGTKGYYDCALCFYESSVDLKNIRLHDNNVEDALYGVKSSMNVRELSVSKITSDGFDCDFCELNISDSQFTQSVGDGLDISGTKFYVNNCVFDQNQDKGFSVGEKSEGLIKNSYFKSNNIAIAIKDGSKAKVTNLSYLDNKQNLVKYIKKNIYSQPEVIYE